MPAIIPIAVAMGASTATAATVAAVATTVATVASVGAAGYSAYAANRASKRAAGVDNAVADYNARQDEALAAQLTLDSEQNIKTQRQENAVYLSKQHVSYAAAGVLATTGSALDAQLTNVGRMEQQIQQTHVDTNQKLQQYASSASVGRLEGQARAYSDRQQGKLALINGGARIASSLFGAYNSGVFAGMGSGGGGGGGGYFLDS